MSACLSYYIVVREFLAPGFECVHSNGERSLRFICLDELHHLVRVEECQEVIDELLVVVIVGTDVPLEVVDVVFAAFTA